VSSRHVIVVCDADEPAEHALLHTAHEAPLVALEFAPKHVGATVLLSADDSGVVQLWLSHVLPPLLSSPLFSSPLACLPLTALAVD